MISLWTATSRHDSFPALDGDKKTDVLIIGGGLAGLICAYELSRRGVDYILVESGSVCGGVTKSTTAKLTFQHSLIYSRLELSVGAERAKMYLSANQEALERYRRLCHDIDCDFTVKDNYVYSVSDRKKLEDEVSAVNRLGFPATFEESVPLPFRTAGAVRFPEQAQFHPLRFAASLSKGLNIYENTRVKELRGTEAVCNGGTIRAKAIIVATHFPFINKHGGYFLKLYQQRSYVTAFADAPDYGGMYIDEAEGGLSFRNASGMLLVGGASGRTGTKSEGWQTSLDFAELYCPGSRAVYRWATQDCMTLDGIPYIGRYSNGSDNLYVATGFNKWGMTTSMVASGILCDLVTGKQNDYAALFSPSRSILHPQLAKNAFEAVKSIITPTTPRCPHLGCALKRNPHEHSWDCPCHGSRFDENGALLDNPATGDLKRKQK